MKKTIQVIMKKTYTNLGNKNEVKTVSLGYASNYLIPNGIAEMANTGKLKQIKMFTEIKHKKELENQKVILKRKIHLDTIEKISIKKKVGQNQQIFGKINEKDIIQQLHTLTGERLQKRHIIMPNINSIGIYNIKIKLTDTINTTIKTNILPNNF